MANVISLFLSMSRIGDLQGSLSISIQHCCLRVSLISLQSPLSAPTFLDPLFSYSYFSFGSGCYSLWLYLLQSIHLDCWQRLHHIATYCLQNCQVSMQRCVDAVPLCLHVFVLCCHVQWFHSFPQQWPWDSNESRNLFSETHHSGFCLLLSLPGILISVYRH